MLIFFRTIFTNSSEIIHDNKNNLFFGLRGAGSSLAIVTKFLYTVHRKPETRPAIILIWLNTKDDFDNILKFARNSQKYSLMVTQAISSHVFWPKSIFLTFVMHSLPLAMKLLKWSNKKPGFPVQAIVTDIGINAGRFTDPIQAERELVANGVDVLANNWQDLKILRMYLGANGSLITTAVNSFGLAVYDAIEKEQEGTDEYVIFIYVNIHDLLVAIYTMLLRIHWH